MSQYSTFEQLCMKDEKGFVYDEEVIVKPKNPDGYDEVVFKLITKFDINLLLLKSHKGGKISEFTIEAIELDPPSESVNNGFWGIDFWNMASKRGSKKKNLAESVVVGEAWNQVKNDYDGLITVAVLGPNAIPNNDSRKKYTLAQFVHYVISSIESYYMFNKPQMEFNPSHFRGDQYASIQDDTRVCEKGYAIVMLWKIPKENNNTTPVKALLSPIQQKRNIEEMETSPVRSEPKKIRNSPQQISNLDEKEIEDIIRTNVEEAVQNTMTELGTPKRRGRKSIMLNSPMAPRYEKIDDEISIASSKDTDETKESSDAPSINTDLDTTFGFERKTTKRGNKSMSRKSILPDWPEDQKEMVLDVFDNLNPQIPETTQIALTCKYASMQFDKDLSSKVLYSWVQKKGRVVNRTINSFELDKEETQKTAIEFYQTLNESQTEGSRVAFVIKYFKSQFNISFSSKDLITWLSQKDKPKGKATKSKRK